MDNVVKEKQIEDAPAIGGNDEGGTFRIALEGDESGALLIGGDDDGR